MRAFQKQIEKRTEPVLTLAAVAGIVVAVFPELWKKLGTFWSILLALATLASIIFAAVARRERLRKKR